MYTSQLIYCVLLDKLVNYSFKNLSNCVLLTDCSELFTTYNQDMELYFKKDMVILLFFVVFIVGGWLVYEVSWEYKGE